MPELRDATTGPGILGVLAAGAAVELERAALALSICLSMKYVVVRDEFDAALRAKEGADPPRTELPVGAGRLVAMTGRSVAALAAVAELRAAVPVLLDERE